MNEAFDDRLAAMWANVSEIATTFGQALLDGLSALWLTIAGAIAWIGRLLDTHLPDVLRLAEAHPMLLLAGVVSLALTLIVTRNLLILSAVSFIAIAAIIGSEPVADADLRLLFTIGCFVAIAFVVTALALERRRSRKLKAAYQRSEEALEELRGKYEGEVRWRMADKRSPPPASEMPSYTFEQKAQNAEPYALAASASPAAEMRTA
ncbi:MAG: hypothetical protein KAG89_08835 [Fulvimarina manganoxydans]|uniref:hypothetical protein n=1 Tax=Fulvimarina manganoxydans TaxID=937218 RepID=UPI0023547035|nr:hypothetical protein [Fulvimarina manganoxydans]MCK5932260.1 hypothetical protein [Fulvimarina manganoxydans]